MMLNATLSKAVLSRPLGLRPCTARQVSCSAEAAKVRPCFVSDADRRNVLLGALGRLFVSAGVHTRE